MPTQEPQDLATLFTQLKEMSKTNLFEPSVKGLQSIAKITEEVISKIGPKAISDAYGLIDNQIKNLQKSMGSLGTFSNEFKQNMANAAGEMGKFGVKASEAYANTASMQQSFIVATGRNAEINSKTLSEIQAAAKLSGQDSATIIKNFIQAGRSLEDVGKFTEIAMNRASELGVSGEMAAKNMFDNMSAMDKFTFKGGMEGFSNMAAESVNMNANMQKTLQFSEQALDLDKANSMAAAFNRMGATQEALLDPTRMSFLAQNDPAELQRQIAELSASFMHMNEAGQIEVLPGARETLQEIGKFTQLGTDEILKMGKATFELGDKMDQLSFPTEDEAMGISMANKAMLGAGGEYKVSSGGKQTGIGEAGAFDIDKMKQEAAPKDLIERIQSQMTLAEKQYANTEAIGDNISGQLAVSENLLKVTNLYDKTLKTAGTVGRESLNPKGFQDLQSNIMKAFEKAMGQEDLTKMKKVFSSEMSQAVTGAIDTSKGVLAAEPQIDDLKNQLKTDFPTLITKLTELVDLLKRDKTTKTEDLLKTKEGNFQLLPEDGIIAGTNVDKIMSFAKEGGQKLVDQTKQLAKTTGDIAKTSINKVKYGPEQSGFQMMGAKANESNLNKPKTPSESELSETLPSKDAIEAAQKRAKSEGSKSVGGEITLNLNFTADSNSAGFADKIVEIFKTNTELQQTVTKEIAKAVSGQGTFQPDSFDGSGKGKSKITSV